MIKFKAKIVENFRKTSSFGWRIVPKWKQEFIALNGANAFEVLIKGKNIQNPVDRNFIFVSMIQLYELPKNTIIESDVFKFHNGVDFVGSDNKLLAIADGIITEVEKSDLSGNYIKVLYKFDDVEYLLSYCHLKTHTPTIENDTVKKGEWIAVMGNSGVTSTGVHCHLTVKNFETGEVIDPETIFEFI